jgi:hypothetical protein
MPLVRAQPHPLRNVILRGLQSSKDLTSAWNCHRRLRDNPFDCIGGPGGRKIPNGMNPVQDDIPETLIKVKERSHLMPYNSPLIP